MLGFLLAVLVSIGLFLFPTSVHFESLILQITTIVVGLSFFLLFGLTAAFAFAPLQKVEQKLTPRLLELFHKDQHLHLIWVWVVFFTVSSLLLGIAGFSLGGINPIYLVVLWLLAFGITIDLYRYYASRILGYLNPFVIVRLFTERAKQAVRNEQEVDLCNYVDALGEVGMKALNQTSTSLCGNAIDEMQKITKAFLESEKSISHHESETVGFILFYIFQRYEMIATRAVEMKLEPINSALVAAMGKIALYAAKFDLSLVSFPLHYLGKFALAAQTAGLPEVGVRGTCTLLEVAKKIIDEVDLSYAELQDPYFSLIGQLEKIAKEAFRQDKKINFKILNQPFLDLKELFSREKVSTHRDTPAILKDIDRVLDEFSNLESVMKTIPPILKPADKS